jgi:hypothetical protein
VPVGRFRVGLQQVVQWEVDTYLGYFGVLTVAYALVDVPARDGFAGCAISQIAARTGTTMYGPLKR